MVSLQLIRASNQQIATALPAKLIAVFVGGTSGIGETSLKQFAKHAKAPRIYFVGRSDEAAGRIKRELQSLNPDGDYIFVKCDASLLRNVDIVCRDIAAKEEFINLLFLSTGTLITGTKTEEGLHFFTALTYYSRIRFIAGLLPLLKQATGLRRVVNVFAGGKEGPISTSDFQAYKLGPSEGRGHLSSMLTLSLEALARDSSNVSFVHDYPGFVKSNLGRGTKGVGMAVAKALFKVVGLFLNIPNEEVGERHTFFCTSARFPPSQGVEDAAGVTLSGIQATVGTDGNLGSGVYSIDYEGEPARQGALQSLAGLRQDGTSEKLWKHVQDEFTRVAGPQSI
ncbi:hydrogenase/reductase-like protein [Truncatella angustata]|uniref:Hydrogenase/reductase-like protein n=1 Tax=Truncatella angustata TaxID=152316 RepID=A0A9P9A367_9PEZI|nr:hydrogenase/reductase-like protein [Truncatella angustata]KAH6658940.1 hydrogenase/reductase-like protein [Truncatella angustata]KAH8196244.1 hypothetical protein TruAng_009601 [Truncatella angustata]